MISTKKESAAFLKNLFSSHFFLVNFYFYLEKKKKTISTY